VCSAFITRLFRYKIGTSGGNRDEAVYASEGKRIGFENIGATRMVCGRPEGVMAQYAAFLRALEKAIQLRIDEDLLELHSDDGALQAHAFQE
jgi:heat shock protein HslJ